MTISYLSLWFPPYLPPKSPDEIVSLSHFSFQMHIVELPVTQSDVITCSDFTTRISARMAFLMWISDCFATCCPGLPGEFCPWSLDLMLPGLRGFGDCDRHYVEPSPDARFDLHKLPQPNFKSNSAKFSSDNFCDLLKIKVSLSEMASC